MAQNGAESVVSPKTNRRSDRFLNGLKDVSSVTFVSHVNPDPDSLGSMMGLAHLVQTRLKKPTRLVQDGVISRAENRAMVDLLKIDLLSTEELTWSEGEVVVMVDSQPGTGRHNLPKTTPLYAVLDHHETGGNVEDVAFVDVRTGLGATCTLVTNYLIEQEAKVPKKLATALLYGIETELNGYPREASPADDIAVQFLYPLADKNLLAQIRNAPVPLPTFECLLEAMQRSFIYDRLIISWVNDLPQPELTAEVADFLVRFEAVDWALCAGVYEEKLIFSLRAGVENANAGELLRKVAKKMGGTGGGHDRRAGGAVPLVSTTPSAIEQVQGELRRHLVKALDIDECRGQRLVARKEMLQNLQT